MKKLFVTLLVSAALLVSTNAFAFSSINTYWDVKAIDPSIATGDGITELIKEFNYLANTTSEISSTGGIIDAGSGYLTNFNVVSGAIPFLQDKEGFGNTFAVTFDWDNLLGQVYSNTGGIIKANYSSGDINFYAKYRDSFSVLQTVNIATVSVTSGSYVLDVTGNAGSSYLLNGVFTSVLDGFWFAEGGQDLNDFTLNWVVAYTAGDTDFRNTTITNHDDGSITVVSPHDSSIEVGVVPEPATLALFGLGLLSLAGVARRKK